MKFPPHLDSEDMELFRKEAQLAGWDSNKHGSQDVRPTRFSMVFQERSKKVMYVQAIVTGMWVLFPGVTPRWRVATKHADEYELKHQDSLTDTST